MIVIIATLSLIGMIVSLLDYSTEGRLHMNPLFPAILTVATWEAYFPMAIATSVFATIIIISGKITKD
jgi:hypothetical protein